MPAREAGRAYDGAMSRARPVSRSSFVGALALLAELACSGKPLSTTTAAAADGAAGAFSTVGAGASSGAGGDAGLGGNDPGDCDRLSPGDCATALHCQVL